MITQALEGDNSTLLVGQLFDHYSDAIFAYLYRLLASRELAEELAQETFLRAFASRQRLAQVDNRRAWLYRVATNVAFDHLRRGRRFAWLPWASVDDLHAPQGDASEAAGERDAVEKALLTLPLTYRAPLLLQVYDGLSVNEVAAALGLTEGAVKMRLHRARAMFKQAYQKPNGGRS